MEEGKRTWEEWNSLWTFQLWLPDDRSEEHFIDRGDQLQDIKEKVQMHLLIHSYARKIGQSRLADLLAPVQFGLANKAELYWRRGCCKESLFIIIIIKERNNFEHFVCIYTKGREEKKIMERSQTLSLPKELRSVPWKVAGKIWLKCSANTCCRTFMSSWTKDQKKYRESMQRVEEIYLLNAAKFEENPLSKVYFHNSYARLLSD